ncbi:hypothetical protein VP381E491_P0008 [Vibrio phage 381E49-1]|nr:hypothetical protein VP381E491_P0008 [Vibrio phage 381E49-1]
MSIDGYLKEGISVDSQPCFGSLVTISTIDGDIGMIEREFSLLVEKAVNSHDRMVGEIAELRGDSLELIKAIKFLYKNTKHINELQSKNIESMIEYHETKLNKND